MRKLLVFLLVLGMYATSYASDPCDPSSGNFKSSAAINISSTTKIVTNATSGKAIYVCGYNFTAAAGTSATYTWNEGTGSTCGTGTVADSGAYAGAAGLLIDTGFSGTVFRTLYTDDLCLTLGGSGGSAQGVVSYVIAP